MHTPRRLFLLMVAVAVCACKSRDAREAERVDKALSWVATAGSITRAWVENRVPVHYAERTLQEAQDELKASEEPDGAEIVGLLRDAIRHRDRGATSQPLASLQSRWSVLRARSDRLKGTSE